MHMEGGGVAGGIVLHLSRCMGGWAVQVKLLFARGSGGSIAGTGFAQAIDWNRPQRACTCICAHACAALGSWSPFSRTPCQPCPAVGLASAPGPRVCCLAACLGLKTCQAATELATHHLTCTGCQPGRRGRGLLGLPPQPAQPVPCPPALSACAGQSRATWRVRCGYGLASRRASRHHHRRPALQPLFRSCHPASPRPPARGEPCSGWAWPRGPPSRSSSSRDAGHLCRRVCCG